MTHRKQIKLFFDDNLMDLQKEVNKFLLEKDPSWIDKIFITPHNSDGFHTVLVVYVVNINM